MHSVLLFLFVVLLGASLAIWHSTGLLTRAISAFNTKKNCHSSIEPLPLHLPFLVIFLSAYELQSLPDFLPALLAAGQ